MTSAGRTVLLNELTMASTNPPSRPTMSAPPPKLSVHAPAPVTTSTANKIPVRVTTSSIVMRPIRSDDAAGAL